MFKMSASEIYALIQEFINSDSNYMSVSYGVQIKIQESILKFNEGSRHTEEELYEHLFEVCPKFVEWFSNRNVGKKGRK